MLGAPLRIVLHETVSATGAVTSTATTTIGVLAEKGHGEQGWAFADEPPKRDEALLECIDEATKTATVTVPATPRVSSFTVTIELRRRRVGAQKDVLFRKDGHGVFTRILTVPRSPFSTRNTPLDGERAARSIMWMHLAATGRLFAVLALAFATPCDGGSSSSPATSVPDGGGTLPDGGTSTPGPDGSTPDGSTSGGCSIAGDNYAINGAQLFKVSADLTSSVLVAKITNAIGVPFNSAGTLTTGAQVGTTLVVTDTNCPFCAIALPPVIVDGTVKAEPIDTGLSNNHFFFDPSIPNNVVVWTGNGNTFLQYDLAQKMAGPSAGIATNGAGLFCIDLYSVKGTIQTSAYDVRLLARCGDGGGATFTYLIHAGGTKVNGNWQQDLFETIASTKGMATNPQIEAGDLTLGIYVGAANKVYVESNGTFVPDAKVYSQCNPATGKSNPGARPLVATAIN